MGKIKVVLIEDSVELCESIKRFFQNENDFEIIGVEHNGVDGLKLIEQQKPDIALIDIIMPQMDGIAILEELKARPDIPRPICIMLTAVSHQTLTSKALKLGVDYFALKPFDLEVLARRMLDLYNYRNEDGQTLNRDSSIESYATSNQLKNPANFAADILQKLGIPSNLNGYFYLKHAITLVIEDQSMLSSITKILYPTIAKLCGTTAVRVERSVRHAIESSWSRDYEQSYKDNLGYSSVLHEKPTNSFLISLIVEKYFLINKR